MKLTKESRVVVLTGAGISAESGLKTFRDNNGLWENHRVEEVATPEAFENNPEMVWRFYKQRYFQLSEVTPNDGHLALKRLEKFLGNNFTLITQNVDGLHNEAGNKRVNDMHGSLKSCFCISCAEKFQMSNVDLTPTIPICTSCGGYLRPDIVWFGEMPYHLENLYKYVENADIFLVVGTSGNVYPAAQFIAVARQAGAYTIGINLEKPLNSHYMHEFHQGRSGKVLPRLLKIWMSE